MPVQYWTTNNIYTPDCWYSDVPDTFALLRRSVSDIYFELDKMVDEHVMCAGGPDFDPSTLKNEYLMSKAVGFTQEEANAIQKENCLTRFPKYRVKLDKQTKITWTMAGISEFLTKRKLNYNNISIVMKTMEMAPFFTFIVRSVSHTMCFYLRASHFIPWERTHKSVNIAISPGCDAFSKDVARSLNNPDQFSVCNYLPKPADGSSCLVDKLVSDNNFMPFRIRFRGKCIMHRDEAASSLNVSNCINYQTITNRYGTMEKYSERQLFHFYPLVSSPQHISIFIAEQVKRLCLTALPPPGLYSGQSKPRIKVVMRNCVYSKGQALSNQLFEVIIPIGAAEKASFKPTKEGKKDPTTMATSMYVKDRVIGVTSYARFRWTAPWDAPFCLLVQTGDSSAASLTNLVLIPCSDSPNNSTSLGLSSSSNSIGDVGFGGASAADPSWEGKAKRHGHMFLIERSLVNGDPYKSGVMLGHYPIAI